MGHVLSYRYEARLSRIGAPSSQGVLSYPCPDGCNDPDHRASGGHNGRTRFIYAKCMCGWEQLSGEIIYEPQALLQGQLAFLQHQIDVLVEEKRSQP